MTVVLVAAAAAAGAAARYVVDAVVSDRAGGALPWGTLTVNAAGSLLAGMLLGLAPGADRVRIVAAFGFLGSFTTFSTFAYETVALALDGAPRAALRNIVANVGFCVAAASAGLGAVTLLTR